MLPLKNFKSLKKLFLFCFALKIQRFKMKFVVMSSTNFQQLCKVKIENKAGFHFSQAFIYQFTVLQKLAILIIKWRSYV